MFYYIGFGLIEVIFEISKFVTEFIIPSRSTETVDRFNVKNGRARGNEM